MKVLLGVGGTEDSIRALEQTVDRVREAGDELTVAVLDNPESDPAPEDVAQEVRETLDAAAIDAEVRRVEGDPGSRLVEIAEHEGFEQIVIGGGQTSPMGKIKIGQVAEFVLLNSHVTVTLVR
ncbi:universal stress protein [Salinirubrum litoreum]|uniref:Universal stress protein n=1 Tax=Salinirubrum litoreum TaxID=1126234 RepID=A0ABD5R653_9EURY|nr:universal stress protein [Salinirubrum litoreum]